MKKDVWPLKSELNSTTPGEQDDIYALVATWHQSLETALERGGADRFRTVYNDNFQLVAEYMTRAATDTETGVVDWDFILEFTDAYPPGSDERTNASPVIADAVARGIVRTRLIEGVAEIPEAALEYLAGIQMRPDGEPAWESSHHFGFAIGHPDYDVAGQIIESAATSDMWSRGCTESGFVVDQRATADVIEELAHSDETTETAIFVTVTVPLYSWLRDNGSEAFVHPMDNIRHRFLETGNMEFSFSTDETARNHLRQILVDIGYAPDVDGDWDIADLPPM